MPKIKSLTVNELETLPTVNGHRRELKSIHFCVGVPFKAVGLLYLTPNMHINAEWDHNGQCFIAGEKFSEYNLVTTSNE